MPLCAYQALGRRRFDFTPATGGLLLLCCSLLVSKISATNSVLPLSLHNGWVVGERRANLIDNGLHSLCRRNGVRASFLVRSIPRGGSTSATDDEDNEDEEQKSTETETKPKKTKKKRKKNTKKAKTVIETAMKEKDSADALGDAIR